MISSESFYLFLITSILINLSPGPDMIYTAARSLSQGKKAGIVSALGIFAGCFVHIIAAVFGLSKIIEESVFVFSLIKYAGAAYLVFLGVKAIIQRKRELSDLKNLESQSYQKIFMQGMITNILNPKVAIFFLSFLPQFIDPAAGNVAMQIAFYGLWFDVQGALILVTVALITGHFSVLLKKKKGFWKWQEIITGTILIALGIKMLFTRK